MTFPFYFHVGGLALHPHLVFECAAYTIGFQYYLRTRDNSALPFDKALWIVIGAIIGAVLGSKLLFYCENPQLTLLHCADPAYLIGGKTIVGGLLGGLIGVEFTKKRIGWKRRTGDSFVMPLIIGMSIGRVGCFLTGLEDDTCGKPTNWFTGVNFGDRVPRHPTQLYEIAFLILLAFVLYAVKRRAIGLPEGARFQMFLFAYLFFRFAVDFLKPVTQIALGLGSIQIACIVGMLYYSQFVTSWFGARNRLTEPVILVTPERLNASSKIP